MDEINRPRSTTDTLLELLNIMNTMSDEYPEPNSDFEHFDTPQQSGEGVCTQSQPSLNPEAPNMGLTHDDIGPYLAPSAIDFVHRRMYHSYFAPDAQRTFPSTDARC